MRTELQSDCAEELRIIRNLVKSYPDRICYERDSGQRRSWAQGASFSLQSFFQENPDHPLRSSYEHRVKHLMLAAQNAKIVDNNTMHGLYELLTGVSKVLDEC